jgi:guanylate kinase
VDVKGARSIRRAFPKGSTSVFILPPDIAALSQRLKKRSTESKKDIARRLERVKIELAEMRAYDYIVVNDKFSEALDQLKAVLSARRCESPYVLRSLRKTDR